MGSKVVDQPVDHEIRRVALLGADGTLGAFILPQLIKHFEVTVLKRATSQSLDTYPAGVHIKKISADFPKEEVAEALQGQDAVVLSVKGTQVNIQKCIARACIKANVKRLIPADFGSCDSATQRAQELVPLFSKKTELRDFLISLANKNPGFTWTALVTGHLFDWLEFMKIDLQHKKVSVLDDGEVKASYSTRDRVGEAVCHILNRPLETANKVLFIQSFYVTQNQITNAFERATGSKWEVERVDSKSYESAEVKKRDQGDGEAIENLVWLLGVLEGNWPAKEGFAMELLNLKDQDLQAVIDSIVKQQN